MPIWVCLTRRRTSDILELTIKKTLLHRAAFFFRKRRMGCADWAPNQRQIIIVHSHSQTHLSATCRQEAIRRCRVRQGKATAQPRVRAAQGVRSRCGRGNIASTGGTADNRTPLSGTDARQQSSSAAPPISRDEEPDRHFRRLQSFLQGTPKNR